MLKRFVRKLYFKLFIKKNRLPNEDIWQYKYRLDILSYYLRELNRRLFKDERKVINYLKRNNIHYFPYNFKRNYKYENIKVFFDLFRNLSYVMHNEKRLYFKKTWNEDKIRKSYNFLLIEQDPESPHRYLTEDFQVESNDIVLDIGSAEGNFALSIIDEVKRIYIFEADKEWIEALYATFEPWKEKVVIINKFVSDKTSEESICLDDFIQEKIDFIKGDVEGEELKIIQGAKEIIQKYCPKVLMCTYHKGNDSEALKIFLEKNDYKIHFSAGYIIFLDDPKPPYLRRGLIRAEKQCH